MLWMCLCMSVGAKSSEFCQLLHVLSLSLSLSAFFDTTTTCGNSLLQTCCFNGKMEKGIFFNKSLLLFVIVS